MSGSAGLAPFSVILGDDTVGKEAALAAAMGSLRSHVGELTEQHFDSTSETVGSFVQRFLTPSLFQDIRLFVIRHAQSLTEKDFSALKDVLPYHVPDAFLIIEGEVIKAKGEKKSQKFESWIKHYKSKSAEEPQKFSFQEFSKPREWEIPDWVVGKARSVLGRTMGSQEAQFLIDLVGNDLGILLSELRKIDLHLPTGAKIDRSSVEEICGVSRTATPEDLAVALGRKNVGQAMELIDNLFASNVSPPLIVSGIFKHFWALYRIRKWAEAHREEATLFLSGRNRNAVNEIGVAIGVAAGLLTPEQANRVYPVIIKSGIVIQAKGFKEPHLRAIIEWLSEFDIDLKTGRIDPTILAIQTLCYKIARVECVSHGVPARQ